MSRFDCQVCGKSLPPQKCPVFCQGCMALIYCCSAHKDQHRTAPGGHDEAECGRMAEHLERTDEVRATGLPFSELLTEDVSGWPPSCGLNDRLGQSQLLTVAGADSSSCPKPYSLLLLRRSDRRLPCHPLRGPGRPGVPPAGALLHLLPLLPARGLRVQAACRSSPDPIRAGRVARAGGRVPPGLHPRASIGLGGLLHQAVHPDQVALGHRRTLCRHVGARGAYCGALR